MQNNNATTVCRISDRSPFMSQYVPQRTDAPFKQTHSASYLLAEKREQPAHFLLTHHRKTITMQTETLKITGMSCGGCVGTIEGALTAVPGVSSAKVSLANHEATVQFSEGQTSHQQLQSAIEKAGYGVEKAGVAAAAPAKGGCCG